MNHPLLRRLALAILLTVSAASAVADELQLSIRDGRVTLVADNVPVRQILEEWARVGESQILNLDKLAPLPVTLRLENVPEREALDILLRSAAGYLVAPRPAGTTGVSMYDRILVLAVSQAPPSPTRSPASPASFSPPPVISNDQFAPPPVQGEPGQMPPLQPYPGAYPGIQPVGDQVPDQPQQPVTAPQPGFLPVPQPQQPSLVPPPGVPVGVPQPGSPIIRPPGGPGGAGPGR